METNPIYCMHCGAENPAGARFCFKCGKPLASVATEVLSLACPTCGGKLEITPEVTRFVCMYCGNEHLVRRGNGATTIEPVLRELQAVRQDIHQVQQSGAEVIRTASSTAQAVQAAQSSAAVLAQRGSVMQQISMLEKSLEEKKKEKLQHDKQTGAVWFIISFCLGFAAVILYYAIEPSDETLAITFALLAGMSAIICLFVSIGQAISSAGKKKEKESLIQDIAAIEKQIEALRSQIYS